MVDSDFSVVSVVPVVPVVPKKISDPRDPRDPRDKNEHAPKGSSLPRLFVRSFVRLSARQSSFFSPNKKSSTPKDAALLLIAMLITKRNLHR